MTLPTPFARVASLVVGIVVVLTTSFTSPAAALPTTRGAGDEGDEELVTRTRELVESLAQKDAFSGAVLVARGDEILLEMAVGEASKRFHVPNTVETKFNLGSMNKMFTSVAIAQLVELGVIAFDDPISKYVDETWLPKETTDRITVEHLLTHTSGLGSYFNRTYMESSRALFRAVDDYKPLVNGDTLAFEPGTRYQYSNTGMLLLGVVIESATGSDYFDYVRKNIYAPAGMESSDCYEMDSPVENLAIGYDPDPESDLGWRNNLYMHVLRGGPAGGGFSTVRDLHRFALALLEGKLVGPTSAEKLWTDHAGAGYGCGFSVEDGAFGKVVGHSGGFPGISANLDIYLDGAYVVAVMSNYSGGVGQVRPQVRSLVFERIGE